MARLGWVLAAIVVVAFAVALLAMFMGAVDLFE